MTIELRKRNPALNEYKSLRNSIGWWDTDSDETYKALNNSLFSVVALENNEVVGIARVIGDGGLYFYIQDLIVNHDYQNNGVGKALMK